MHHLEELVWASKYVLPDYSTARLSQNTKFVLNIVSKNKDQEASVAFHFENILMKSPANFRQITTTCKDIKDKI